ncbi:MAG: NAD(P)H-hydrate dehydratase [Kiritimatiellae bacterium]|nr:NAD(P)H-hydrate dehydratase [Kiritimatiellia bacterium]
MKKLPQQLRDAFPKRPLDLHKYSAGTVTIVGGSVRFVHAPVIAGLGARAAGAGLVQLVVPDASRIAAGCLVPEATFTKQTPACVPPKADVMAIGMGLGTTQNAEMLLSRLLSGSAGRFVLDADALTILANWYARKSSPLPVTDGQSLVLTPHAGEAARLLACSPDDVLGDRLSALKRIVERYRAIVVLKGPSTLVGAPGIDDVFTCDAGNPFMAMGGMGDLLSGVIAARWARLARSGRDDAMLAASASVWMHASASDSIVHADPPGDPSIVNTAHAISSIRVSLER